jgi:hypothetical protein
LVIGCTSLVIDAEGNDARRANDSEAIDSEAIDA